MQMLWVAGVVALIAGCKFDEVPLIDGSLTDAALDGPDADAAVDAPVDAPIDAMVDAPPQCTASTIDCDDATDVYTECSVEGTVTRQFSCSLGCATGQEKCIELDPQNGWAVYVDMVRDRADLPDVAFAGSSRIQTFDGVVFNGANSITVPSLSAENGNVRVFLFKSLSIAGVVKVPAATQGLVLVVDGEVVIDGTLDVSADGPDNGPGATLSATCAGTTANPGPAPSPGAGGAGRHTNGGAGGADGTGDLPPTQGAQHFDEDLVPLRGGCRGGGVADLANHFSTGGGSGGVVQIVSRTAIRVVGNGKIDASGGGGGHTGDNLSGGAGGGSGGGILLEAPQIVLDGAGVVLSTKGGGGAAPGGLATSRGSDGGFDAVPAAGGTAAGQPSGGAGGVVNTAPTNGGAGAGASGNGAGGGGAAGVAMIFTATGAINPQNGAAIRSSFQVRPLETRLVP